MARSVASSSDSHGGVVDVAVVDIMVMVDESEGTNCDYVDFVIRIRSVTMYHGLGKSCMSVNDCLSQADKVVAVRVVSVA